MALVRIIECSWKQICKFGSSHTKNYSKTRKKKMRDRNGKVGEGKGECRDGYNNINADNLAFTW